MTQTPTIHRNITISRREVLAGGAAFAAMAAAGPVLAQTAASGAQQIVLITGTSSGFGRLMAEAFARKGLRVVATMREVAGRNAPAADELRALATAEDLQVDIVEIDVTDQASVDGGVAEAVRLAGRIDFLVSNAGIVVPGPVEIQPPNQFLSNIETNLVGALRMYRSVVPHMRDQGGGTIIQMSSALGRAIDPMLGGYCASKLAVEAAADALGYEVAAAKIEVTVVQPAGAYPTRFQANGLRYWEELLATLNETDRSKLEAYAPHIEAMLAGLEPDPALDPREVSDAVVALAAMKFGTRPERLTVGPYKDGIDPVNAAHTQLQKEMMEHNPIVDLLTLD